MNILVVMMMMSTTRGPCGKDDGDDDRLWRRAEKGRKRTTWLADDDGCEDGGNKKPNIQNILNVKSGYQPRSASKSDTSTRQLIFPTNITKNIFSLATNKAPIHLLSIEKWNYLHSKKSCVTRAPLLYFIRSWVALSFKVCEWVSESVRDPWTCPDLHFVHYIKAQMPSLLTPYHQLSTATAYF